MHRHRIETVGRAELADLFAAELDQWNPDSFDQYDDISETVAGRLRGVGPLAFPKPLHLGIRDPAGRLVAGVFAHPPAANARAVLLEDANASLPMLYVYLHSNLLLAAIAVRAEHRRQGLAAQLVKRCHDRSIARADPRAEFNLTAFATSPAAAALFRSAGFNVGERGQPVPPEFAHGLRTTVLADDLARFPHGVWAWLQFRV